MHTPHTHHQWPYTKSSWVSWLLSQNVTGQFLEQIFYGCMSFISQTSALHTSLSVNFNNISYGLPSLTPHCFSCLTALITLQSLAADLYMLTRLKTAHQGYLSLSVWICNLHIMGVKTVFTLERDYVTFGYLLPQICLHVICNDHAPYSAGWNFRQCFYACKLFCTIAIHWPRCKISPRSSQGNHSVMG